MRVVLLKMRLVLSTGIILGNRYWWNYVSCLYILVNTDAFFINDFCWSCKLQYINPRSSPKILEYNCSFYCLSTRKLGLVMAFLLDWVCPTLIWNLDFLDMLESWWLELMLSLVSWKWNRSNWWFQSVYQPRLSMSAKSVQEFSVVQTWRNRE